MKRNAEEKYFSKDGTTIHYVKFGTGKRNLAIISGISLCGFEGAGPAIAKQYNIFSDEFTCFCFERKRDIPEDYSTEEMADDIYCILKSEGVSSADFFGVSHGGMISLAMALHHSDIVHSIVLGNTSAAKTNMSEKTIGLWYELAKKEDVHAFNMQFYHDIYSPEFYSKHLRALDRLANQGTAAQCRRFCRLVKAIGKFDAEKDLEKIKCPCLVIGSEKDEVLGVDASKQLAKGLGCNLIVYENGAHAAYDEIPEYIQKVHGFISAI